MALQNPEHKSFTPPLPFRTNNQVYRPILFSQRPRLWCPQPLDLSKLKCYVLPDYTHHAVPDSPKVSFDSEIVTQMEEQIEEASRRRSEEQIEASQRSEDPESSSHQLQLFGPKSPTYYSASLSSNTESSSLGEGLPVETFEDELEHDSDNSAKSRVVYDIEDGWSTGSNIGNTFEHDMEYEIEDGWSLGYMTDMECSVDEDFYDCPEPAPRPRRHEPAYRPAPWWEESDFGELFDDAVFLVAALLLVGLMAWSLIGLLDAFGWWLTSGGAYLQWRR